ncbi:MAG: beta-lactamase family protein, partial [Chloroflexi bacterium]|nr:beta-lactamase family protein [Chloroflexota bacterium]
NFWGLLDATYHPEAVTGADQIQAEFVRELADRFPTKPIEQMAVDYPGVDVSQFGANLSPDHLTSYGFVIDGVNYVSACHARYGRYTYCDSMRAPSWSTAKSAFASVALMRLAQKYDADAPNLLIQDYLPETVDSPGDWSQVTFDDTLDMATGNYRSSRRMVDEEQFSTDPFWGEEYYAGKIAAALDWPHSADPGTQWVYRTSDTFIVTSAMNNYLQAQA